MGNPAPDGVASHSTHPSPNPACLYSQATLRLVNPSVAILAQKRVASTVSFADLAHTLRTLRHASAELCGPCALQGLNSTFA